MTAPALVIERLSVGYRVSHGTTRPILTGIDATLERGEFTCLLGPNGTGKSTLLRTLARFQPSLGGRVTVAGRDIRRLTRSGLARLLAVVLTDRIAVGAMTAYDLVGLGRSPYTGWGGRLREHDHAVIGWALTATRSDDLAQRDLAQLSDGERQRVMIARALAQEPMVMLLDEPTAFLDVPRRVEITGLLRRLARETGLAILLSTHDLELALRTADTIWLLTPDRRFVTGAPEDLALDGALASAFPSPDLDFDTQDGAFRPRRSVGGRASLRATGAAALWTRRALQRQGFDVMEPTEDDARIQLHVECREDSGGRTWLTAAGGNQRTHRSLAELAAYLRLHAASGDGTAARPDDDAVGVR
jgi:iron complex transport system ATP-binding protein